MVSHLQLHQRAFVSLLLAVASIFSIQVRVNRDSHESALRNAYEEVLAHVGRKRTAKDKVQELRRAKASWEEASVKKAAAGRPPSGGCRFQGLAVLLTYQSLQDSSHWQRFIHHVKKQLKTWNVKYWCATLEACKTGRLHAHLMLQFHHSKDRSSAAFRFDGIPPNVSSHDYLHEGLGRRNPQVSIDRGFFYVYASKLGTVQNDSGQDYVEGNYMPAWVTVNGLATYKVQGKWPEALWKHYKLDDSMYERYLFLARDGVQARKRNLDACKTWRETQEEQIEINAVVKRIRSNPAVYQPFPEVPQVSAWLRVFKTDRLRYPLLIILGPSASGKTEFGKSLFQSPLALKVGDTEVFPAKMVEFKRNFHDALILDDVRDLNFLISHQEKLQGKYDSRIEFATTQGGTCFYTKYLFKIPTVVTVNYTTRHLDFLDSNDWLNKPQNTVLLKWPLPA